MMTEKKHGFKEGKAGSVIAIRVIPRSTKAGIAGIMDDGVIKIRLVSPPVDGKANEELIKLIAKIINCPRSNIEIISGFTAKTKIVAIYGYDSESINKIIRDKAEEKD